MKKYCYLLIIILITLILVSCNEEQVEEVEYDEFGNELLLEIKEMENGNAPWVIFDIIKADIDKVSDPAIKEEILAIANSTVPRIIEIKNEYELRSMFYREYNQMPNNYTYNEYFDKESENVLLNTLNPTYIFLREKGYTQKYFDKYKNIIGIRDRVTQTLDVNGIKYKFPNKTSTHFVVTEDNFVIEREGYDTAIFIYQVFDKNGEVIDPTQLLEPIDNELDKRYLAELNKSRAEEADALKVEIGMTMLEVTDRLGEPEKVSKVTSSFGVKERWKYGNDYYSFEDGILFLISEY